MAAAPAVASSSSTGSRISHNTTSQPRDRVHIQLQRRRIEEKFAQVQKERKEAQALKRDVEMRRTNQKTDEQIMLLMQADERLAALLAQAADSMCALLTADSQDAMAPPTDGLPSHGAKAFELRAQRWFVILSEVQYTLRSAMRYLRDSQLAPLTPPCAPEARHTGLAGSAAKGHAISLMDAFVDTSATDGVTFQLGAKPTVSGKARSLSASETSLSLSALREKERNWKDLSSSLEQVERSMFLTSQKKENQTPSPKANKKANDAAMQDAITSGKNTDRLLLDALLNANGLTS